MTLATEKCEACAAGTPVLEADAVAKLHAELNPAWTVDGTTLLRREYTFPNFNAAFTRATSIALIAEAQGHHPDLEVGWGRVVVSLTTHKIGGLSRNDFVMAARIDKLDAAG